MLCVSQAQSTHMDPRAYKNDQNGKDAAKTTRPSWAQLVWARVWSRPNRSVFKKCGFCCAQSRRATSHDPRSRRMPAKFCRYSLQKEKFGERKLLCLEKGVLDTHMLFSKITLIILTMFSRISEGCKKPDSFGALRDSARK